jgi:hypothetical protein
MTRNFGPMQKQVEAWRETDLYRHHIATEDNEVFPAAAALSATDREAIGKEMASRRGFQPQPRADSTSLARASRSSE